VAMSTRGASPLSNDVPILRVATAGDVPAVKGLLSAAELPVVGVIEAITTFVVAEHRGVLVGVAGLEVCRDNGLLSSVAVAPAWRNRGLARALVSRVITEAEGRRLHAMYLLTTTAAHYFPKFGFTPTTREAVPSEVAATEEFTTACPASAVVMVRPVTEP
jgi:amino-acid N-acetyltransferase